MSGQKPGDPGDHPEDEDEVAKTVMVANPFLVGKTDPGLAKPSGPEVTQVGTQPAAKIPVAATSGSPEAKTKVTTHPGVKAKPTPRPQEEAPDDQEDQEFNGRTVIAKPPFAHVPADQPLSDQALFQPPGSPSTAAMQRLVEEQRRKEEDLPGPDWDDSKLVPGTDLDALHSGGTSLVERPQGRGQRKESETSKAPAGTVPPANDSSAEPAARRFRVRTFVLAGLIVGAGIGAAAFLFLVSGPELTSPTPPTAQTGAAATSPAPGAAANTKPIAPTAPVATSPPVPVAPPPTATAPPPTATAPPAAPPTPSQPTVTPPPASALPPPVSTLPAPVESPKAEHKAHKAEPVEKVAHEEKPAKPAKSKKAFLVIQAPAGVMILIDGKDTGLKTPLSGPMEVPPGDRFVTLVNSAGQKKGYAVSIEAGETYTLSETF